MNAQQLRASLLQMAIEGKLVPQLETEPDVEAFTDEPEDVPFAIPEKWKWCKLPDVLFFQEGPGILAKDFRTEGVPLIRIAGMQGKTVSLNGCNFLDPEMVKQKWNHFKLELGDIVISSSASLDKAAIVDDTTVGAIPYTGLIRFKESKYVCRNFFLLFAKSPVFANQINQNKTGLAIKHFGPTHLKKMFIPVPPINEQFRIVEKLEELLPLVDDYGKAQEQLERLNAEIGTKLRASLLQEAIQGKLVPQLETEPAVEAFADEPEDVPFAIPEKWKWVQLSKIGTIVGGGTPKTSNPDYWGGDVNWITPADLGKNQDRFIASGAKSITQKGLDESSAKLMPPGSIVYSSRAPIGHIAIAKEYLSTNQGCKSFVPNSHWITSDWAYYCLIERTPDIQSRASGTTFKEISGKGVGETWVPLPPLEEQRRIVEKLETLLCEVDKLVQ